METKEKRKLSVGIKLLLWVLVIGLVGGMAVLGVDAYVVLSTRDQILSQEEAAALENVDCILVLGCKVWENGVPSHMLEDRLKRGVALYELGAAPKLLMSGDHGRADYDEVDAMKTYAVEAGVPSADVFMDHAGFSTYETVYRARDVFCAKKVIIVTQEYHLYRALYIAEALGLEAYGVDADYRSYAGQLTRDVREILARVKDAGSCLFMPKPTYLGEAIPIWGSGELTHDEKSDFN
jgi:vancomycin permeability regulator SanA